MSVFMSFTKIDVKIGGKLLNKTLKKFRDVSTS